MSWAISNTTLMSCSIMTISIVRANCLIFSTARSVSAGLMPQVGSSSSNNCGSEISAIPISSNATSPYDSVPAGRCASAGRPICSRVSSTRSRVSGSREAERRQPRHRRLQSQSPILIGRVAALHGAPPRLAEERRRGTVVRPAPVFETMLQNAARLCDAKFGTLYLCEGDALRIVAAYNVPPAFAEVRSRGPFRPAPSGTLGQVMRTKQTVQLADLTATQAYAERDPGIVAGIELGGVRTAVGVPLLKNNELVGIISI